MSTDFHGDIFPTPLAPHPAGFLSVLGRGAWYLHVLRDAIKTVWTSTVFRLLQIKKHDNIVAKKGHSYSPNYAQLVQ